MKTKTKIGAAIVSVVAAALLGGMIFSANAAAGSGECRGPKQSNGDRDCQCTNSYKCSDMHNCKSKASVIALEEDSRMILD